MAAPCGREAPGHPAPAERVPDSVIPPSTAAAPGQVLRCHQPAGHRPQRGHHQRPAVIHRASPRPPTPAVPQRRSHAVRASVGNHRGPGRRPGGARQRQSDTHPLRPGHHPRHTPCSDVPTGTLAYNGFPPVHMRQAGQAVAGQHAVHGRGHQPRQARDAGRSPAAEDTNPDDPALGVGRDCGAGLWAGGRSGRTFRPRRTAGSGWPTAALSSARSGSVPRCV